MALTSANVRVAVSGEVYFGATSATEPATTAAATTGFTGLGYISEDGIVENHDVTRETIKAWQNAATVRESVTEAIMSFDFTLIETTAATVETYYGTSITDAATEGTYTVDPAATAGRLSWVLDVIDGAEKKRIYVEEGELFKQEGVTYASGAAIGYPSHLVCYTNPVVRDTVLKTPA